MNTKLFSAVLATLVLLCVFVVSPSRQAAAVGTPAVITAGGAGVFPAGANFNGVQLAGGTFGVGAQTDGVNAAGDFELQLNGNSLIGLSQWITITGWITSVTANADGSVTLNGTGTLDMGDGTAAVGGLALVANLAPTGMTVTIGGNAIPTLPRSDGWITSE